MVYNDGATNFHMKYVLNSSSQTGFDMSGPQKIQTLLKVRQGQYKTFLLL